jgi:hypothetical protein
MGQPDEVPRHALFRCRSRWHQGTNVRSGMSLAELSASTKGHDHADRTLSQARRNDNL